MPQFAYTGVTAKGQLERGEINAADRAAAIAALQSRGTMPIRAEAAGATGPRARRRHGLGSPHDLPSRAVATSIRGLASLLQAGFTLDRALEIAAQSAYPASVRDAFTGVRARVRDGASFADALAERNDVLPPAAQALIRAGETSGALADVTTNLAATLERANDLRDKVRAGLAYPAVVLGTTALAIGVLLVAVIPEFQPLVNGAHPDIPYATKLVFAASEGLRQNWWVLLAGLAALGLGIQRISANPKVCALMHALALKTPAIGPIWRAVDAASFTRTLGLLLKHGVGPVRSLELASETVSNRSLASSLHRCADPVRQGQGLSQTVSATRALPDELAQMLKLGEQSGQLSQLLMQTADHLDTRIKSDIDRALAKLAPAVTLALGGLVAGVLGALMSAILSSYRLAI